MQERIMNGFRFKLKNKKEDNKGFTLVELIVVIVILAILAALLVPALVGWIDKAREKTYAVEARTVYLAAQTVESEHYDGRDTGYLGTTALVSGSSKFDEVKNLSGVAISSITVTYAGSTGTDAHTIKGMSVTFIPSNGGNEVTMVLSGDTWTKTSP